MNPDTFDVMGGCVWTVQQGTGHRTTCHRGQAPSARHAGHYSNQRKQSEKKKSVHV